jgi:rSAM/selenodomain-associated transferase 2
MAELSIVIPTLNEATALPLLLGDLRRQQGCALEIIVADGGSTDATVALAGRAGAKIVHAQRGRASQMNAGATQAIAGHLLFLHADTRLPTPTLLRDALAALTQQKSDNVAGHFPLRFVRSMPGHDFLFRYLEEKTALNRVFTINGDQGALLSKRFFTELDGFDPRLPYLEDQRLAAQVWKRGRWIVLPGHLLTSARRFELEGHRPRLILMTLMMALHEAGTDELFSQAPQVYASQDKTRKLDLTAYHRLIRGILWRARWKRMAGILWRCGHFVRQNTWQLFYRCDLLRAPRGEYPALAFYDRHLDRLIANRVGDALATLLMCAWFFLWLPITQPR